MPPFHHFHQISWTQWCSIGCRHSHPSRWARKAGTGWPTAQLEKPMRRKRRSSARGRVREMKSVRGAPAEAAHGGDGRVSWMRFCTCEVIKASARWLDGSTLKFSKGDIPSLLKYFSSSSLWIFDFHWVVPPATQGLQKSSFDALHRLVFLGSRGGRGQGSWLGAADDWCRGRGDLSKQAGCGGCDRMLGGGSRPPSGGWWLPMFFRWVETAEMYLIYSYNNIYIYYMRNYWGTFFVKPAAILLCPEYLIFTTLDYL